MYESFGWNEPVPLRDWSEIAWQVRQTLEPQQELWVPRGEVIHPREFGFQPSMGAENEGVVQHWRIAFHDDPELHVREMADGFLVHWDRYQLSKDPVKHFIHDAPPWVKALGVLAVLGLGAVVVKGMRDE